MDRNAVKNIKFQISSINVTETWAENILKLHINPTCSHTYCPRVDYLPMQCVGD